MSAITNSIKELEAKLKSIETAIRTLRALDGGPRPGRPKGNRNISDEGRKRIAEAQRKRWAKVKAEKDPSPRSANRQEAKASANKSEAKAGKKAPGRPAGKLAE